MIDNILRFQGWTVSLRRDAKCVIKPLSRLFKLLTREFCLLVIPISLRLTRGKNSLICRAEDKDNPRVIVSFTSFPLRINHIWMVVEMLFRQSVKPDMIVLYLSNLQFDSIETLPKSLHRYIGRGLEVKLVDGDLRSHKKYHYAMSEYPNDIIITVDDDSFYPTNTLESLLDTYKQYPDAVVSNRARVLDFKDGKLQPYKRWKTTLEGCSYNLLQTGVDGVLYPPYSRGLYYKDMLNKELAMKLTPAGDDLWLYAMTRLGGCRVVRTLFREYVLSIRIRRNVSLYKTNCFRNFNDEQIENLRTHYVNEIGIDPFEYKE